MDIIKTNDEVFIITENKTITKKYYNGLATKINEYYNGKFRNNLSFLEALKEEAGIPFSECFAKTNIKEVEKELNDLYDYVKLILDNKIKKYLENGEEEKSIDLQNKLNKIIEGEDDK